MAMITEDTPSFVDARAAAKEGVRRSRHRGQGRRTISKNASSSESRAKSQKLKDSGADVVYVLVGPTLFLNLAAAGRAENYIP